MMEDSGANAATKNASLAVLLKKPTGPERGGGMLPGTTPASGATPPGASAVDLLRYAWVR